MEGWWNKQVLVMSRCQGDRQQWTHLDHVNVSVRELLQDIKACNADMRTVLRNREIHGQVLLQNKSLLASCILMRAFGLGSDLSRI